MEKHKTQHRCISFFRMYLHLLWQPSMMHCICLSTNFGFPDEKLQINYGSQFSAEQTLKSMIANIPVKNDSITPNRIKISVIVSKKFSKKSEFWS